MSLQKSFQMASTKTVISAAASIAGTALLLRALTGAIVPAYIRTFVSSNLQALFYYLSGQLTLVVDEFDGFGRNELFTAAEDYIHHKASLLSPSLTTTAAAASTNNNDSRFPVSPPQKEAKLDVSIDLDESFVDRFNGAQLKWTMTCKKVAAAPALESQSSETRSLELRFHKKHREMVLRDYLKHVIGEWKVVRPEEKSVKLFTLESDRTLPGRGGDVWQSVNLDHPATFETLAMEPEKKKSVIDDLQRFVKRKEFFRKVGKAWKRGYLLLGPPGTGKSSLIAAMANYLQFDIYDLELSDVRSDSDLRQLLISTANRSILVVEDVDCSIELPDRSTEATVRGPTPHGSQVTLSGVLNFIDGLWSSCGDERIIVFTTNHEDQLDPALLRPGRMDVHINMDYCTPSGFNMLASNYLGMTEHPLKSEAQELMGTANVTPAEISEQLFRGEDAEIALKGLEEKSTEEKENGVSDESTEEKSEEAKAAA